MRTYNSSNGIVTKYYKDKGQRRAENQAIYIGDTSLSLKDISSFSIADASSGISDFGEVYFANNVSK